MKNVWWISVTVVLACVSGALLLGRLGGCRGQDLNTSIGVRQTYKPAEGEKFAAVEDWPAWRGPRGDGISREAVGDAWPTEGLKRLWTADVGLGFSSPIAVGDRLYLFSLNKGKDNLSCFNAQTGELVWTDESDAGWTKDYEGTRATPAVVGDRIYTYGGLGEVACRDIRSGKPVWKKNALAAVGGETPQWGTASSPLIYDGKVIVQAGGGASIAVALSVETGELAWKSQATGSGSYAHPMVVDVDGTKQLVVFAADAVLGMNPQTGATIWREAWNTSYGVNSTTPVYRDRHLYVSSAYGMGGMMLKLSPAAAQKLWAKKDIKSKFQGLILDGDTLIGNSDPGSLIAIAWPDGGRRWKADDSALNPGMGGSIVKAAGDKMIVMSEEGKLSLTRVSPTGIQLLSQFQAFDDVRQVWSTPLLYAGRLYAKGPKELVCFELK
ncbi:PQQ-binding-like beta-propeller repeat protein [Humisphaera borealis]|uniref:PQQ-like beta-propeller repeat protein n=1 Tax=Humisphaera borealis TaxID=2807512 RepID=A0A7M2WVP5_9BACT|nr:PQQ-binding-like beta-propeller repeat protein [Humisphaera borealis]QOV89459.1 PQQ-like beta-propeller repeat protein [Humisphaera borealis]